MPLARRRHVRQATQDQAQAAEIIQLHGALEVVETVVGVLDGAANGTPGVVDQDVDSAQVLHHVVDDLVALPMPEDAPVTTTTLPPTWPRRLRSMYRSGSRCRSQ